MQVGDYVVVRGNASGVFAGVLVAREGTEVTLDQCRRIWRWEGAATCSQLAKDGTSRPDACKFPAPVDGHLVLDALEVIRCTEKARKSIEEVPEWNA